MIRKQCGTDTLVCAVLAILFLLPISLFAQQSPHRAEQDREISYWLLDPATHQFRISHDFTVTRVGQASVHSFVRKGSVVAPDAKMIDLDTGKELVTHSVSGKEVNALARISHRGCKKPPHRAIKLSVSNNLMAREAAAWNRQSVALNN
ncbi:MAG TPA: hypothetical protein VF713_18365 [Thermoanaerobaculia bacterium]